MNVNGKIAERKAWEFLSKKGYKLVSYNYHSRFGEIDLIVEDDNYLVFVEVKMRSSSFAGTPREAVDYYKQQKIIKTATLYLSTNLTNKQPRFDVVEIISANNAIKSIKHLENAFELV